MNIHTNMCHLNCIVCNELVSRIILQLFIRPSFITAFTLEIQRRTMEQKKTPENEIYKEKKDRNKKIIRTKVSLVIIFFIDVALAKIVICCNNYNLCVPRARMEKRRRFSASAYYKIMNLLFLLLIFYGRLYYKRLRLVAVAHHIFRRCL